MSLAKRTIVITGITRGIGRALAMRFVQLGHTLIGCGRRSEAVEAVRRSLAPGPYLSIVDVADADAVNEWAVDVLERFGAPDLVLNNAGVMHPGLPFWEVSQGDFDQLIDINIKGVAHVARAFLPAMIVRGQGLLVNFSSGLGQFAVPNASGYVASKYAIEGLSKAIAEDLPKGLACIPLSPGVIDTEMLQAHWGKERSGECDSPEVWAEYAADYILGLETAQSGKSLRVPQN
ncbi:MAG: SDR family oxidoreductase [Verrucomicrobiota bacterium]